jgi:hypothetical protein
MFFNRKVKIPKDVEKKLKPFKINEKITPVDAFKRGATNVFIYKNGKRVYKLTTPNGKHAVMKGTVWGYGYDHRTNEIEVDIDLPKNKR